MGLALSLIQGCSTAPPPQTPGMQALGVGMTTAELRLAVYRFESYFAAVVQASAEDIAAAEGDLAIRKAALQWRINAIPAMQAAVFQHDPLAALGDAWGLCAQMERFFATGAGKDLFGNSQRIAVTDSKTLHKEISGLARTVVGPEGVENVRPKLEAWLEENTIYDLSFGRRTVGVDASSITAAQWGSGSGGLRSVGQIEDLVRDLSDRLTIYAEQIPEMARWQAELMAMDLDENLLEPRWTDIAAMEGALGSMDAEVKGLRRFVETTPDLVASERAVILGVMEREIETALADIDRQRVASIAALSHVRESMFTDVERLRSVVSSDLQQARVDAMKDLELLVDSQTKDLLDQADRLIDKLFLRTLILLAVSLVGLALVLRWTRGSAGA